MSGTFHKALTALVLAASCSLAVAARAETTAPTPAPAVTEPAPLPVVRQSTPIPNDPEPARPAKPKPAAADATEADTAAPEEFDKPLTHRCFVRDVMAFYDRTHVRCYNPARGKYLFFAVDTSQPVAETLLNKAWKSMRSGKPLTVKYAPTSDLNPTNCAARDCRRLLDVAN